MDELIVATAGTGVARTSHYVTPTGASAPIQTLLLEPQRTNLLIRSEEFDTWSDLSSCAVTANATTAPDGTSTADLLTPTSTGSARFRSYTATGDGEKAFALYVKAGTSSQSAITIYDSTAAVSRHNVRITWTAGVPTLATTSGAGTLYPVEALANGWYRILFSATGVVAANTNSIFLYPHNTGSGTGTIYAWGAQAENAIVPSSYIKTEGTTVTRNADSLYFPFTAPPQAMTVYVRGVEMENPTLTPPASSGVIFIGSATAATPARFIIRKPLTGPGYDVIYDPAGVVTDTVEVGTTAVRNNLIELRGTLSSSGAPRIGVSINGASESVSTLGTAITLPSSWAAQRLYLNSFGTTNVGQFAYTHVIVAAGEQTMATMRSLAGVA